MAARPAQIRSSRPPAARPAARPAAPKRKDDLPITESLLFPRIHYHQCPACERVSGTGSGRGAGRRAGAQAAGGAGPGAPSATLSTSPSLAPALPGHPLRPHHAHARLGSARLRPGSGEQGEGAPRRVRLGPARSDCLLRLRLLPLRRRLASSPRRRRVLLLRRRLLLLPPPLVPPLPLHQLHPGNSAAAAFGNPRHFPPRPSSPTLARSGTPPSANLGSPRPSSSSAAWLASSRPVRSFRSPLGARTRASGRRPSTLGVVRLGEPPETGPGGPGARGAGGAFGRRPVGRARSHRGLNKGGCAAARAPGGAGRGGVPTPAGSGREAPGWAAGGRWPRRPLRARGRELPRRPALRSRTRGLRGGLGGGRARPWAVGVLEVSHRRKRGARAACVPGHCAERPEPVGLRPPGGGSAGAERAPPGPLIGNARCACTRRGGALGKSVVYCFPPLAAPSPPSPFFVSHFSLLWLLFAHVRALGGSACEWRPGEC